MIASLGMYDMPHLADSHDRYWAAIRAALGHGPAKLTRGGDPWAVWRSPDLILAQTCGLPYRARLHGTVTLVGTPDYDLPGCAPGHYFSFLIRRRSDPRDIDALCDEGVMAFNDPLSQSGWAAPVAHLAALGLRPRRLRETGAHLASVAAVRSGKADFAAVDALTFLLWTAHAPDAARAIDAFAQTDRTPALPYITARSRDPDPVAQAVSHAIDAMSTDDTAALRLRGLVQIPSAQYLAVPIPPTPDDLRAA